MGLLGFGGGAEELGAETPGSMGSAVRMPDKI